MSSKTQTKPVAKKTIAPKKTPVIESTPTPVVESKPQVVLEDEVESAEGEDENKRKVVTRDSVLESFDEMIRSIDDEITSLRENESKTKGIKFLRTLNKKLKILKNQSSKQIKQKRTTTKTGNVNKNSGFLKPVQISAEMAKFTGWDATELKSRVAVTKAICAYIKEHKLQNPEDKRQINVDSKLGKLLRYDPKKETEPLTYYKIQSNLKHHFPKTVTETSA